MPPTAFSTLAAKYAVEMAERTVVRAPGEPGLSYYARCLLWTLNTDPGRKAFAEAALRAKRELCRHDDVTDRGSGVLVCDACGAVI